MIVLGQGLVSLGAFAAAPARAHAPAVTPDLAARLAAARDTVAAHAAGEAPVYGLNTGLGGNLAQRLDPGQIADFQQTLLDGRAVAVGPPLPEPTGRAVTLARLVSAARGVSGLSVPWFNHLRACFAAGLSPVIPEHGSLGSSDLVQNAVWARALGGRGLIWQDGRPTPAAGALARAGLTAPPLQPKDAMALINHSGLTVALAAEALVASGRALAALRGAILLSHVGYGANPGVLAPELNALRPAPGQARFAAWLAGALAGWAGTSGRVQEALSFRTVAPVQGAAEAALDAAVAVWTDEANGAPDSPAVLGDGRMASTANFHSPALALALEHLGLALAMAANGAVQRMQRLMSPPGGLPKYLSPRGGASAGFVPVQKTAAALLAGIRRQAMPVAFDPAPVSDAVEDMAPMTPLAARKLAALAEALHLLAGIEGLCAAQAIDLRGAPVPAAAAALHAALRARIDPLDADRALGEDAAIAAAALVAAAPLDLTDFHLQHGGYHETS